MSTSQVQRYLRTEELYKKIIDLYPSALLDVVGETHVRGILDAILSQGKIEGRLSAYGKDAIAAPNHDRLIEDWQRVVDSV